MPYGRLAERLARAAAPTLATLPDGSVDRFCSVSAGARGPLPTLESFGRELADGNRSTFRLRVEATEPGGQSVNTAEQLHALGADVTCYGHLDHPVFDDLAFETVSMGEPALVDAFNFPDGDVMFVEEPTTDGWTLADLEAVADLASVFDVDAVACANWVSFPGLGEAFHALDDLDLPRVPFLLDPGDVVGAEPAALGRLFDALTALQGTFDVVYNANPPEIRATAEAVAGPGDGPTEYAVAIREAAGIEAVVVHGRRDAVAATPDGTTVVENCDVDEPVRHTGGGDHFSGGLAYALALDWDWELALACGNACASYYVERGSVPTLDALRTSLEA